jgi:L-amino acid N-acyltransferase YncA
LVRDAIEQDWPAIWPFFHSIVAAGETFGYDRDLSDAQARAIWFSAPPSRTTVAVDAAGVVLGSAHMHANHGGPAAHIASASFMVDPSYEGRGVGRALLEDVLRWAAHAGYRGMQFNGVAATNDRAIALYRSAGFEILGTVPEGFAHPRHGFVGLHIMYRAL